MMIPSVIAAATILSIVALQSCHATIHTCFIDGGECIQGMVACGDNQAEVKPGTVGGPNIPLACNHENVMLDTQAIILQQLTSPVEISCARKCTKNEIKFYVCVKVTHATNGKTYWVPTIQDIIPKLSDGLDKLKRAIFKKFVTFFTQSKAPATCT